MVLRIAIDSFLKETRYEILINKFQLCVSPVFGLVNLAFIIFDHPATLSSAHHIEARELLIPAFLRVILRNPFALRLFVIYEVVHREPHFWLVLKLAGRPIDILRL